MLALTTEGLEAASANTLILLPSLNDFAVLAGDDLDL